MARDVHTCQVRRHALALVLSSVGRHASAVRAATAACHSAAGAWPLEGRVAAPQQPAARAPAEASVGGRAAAAQQPLVAAEHPTAGTSAAQIAVAAAVTPKPTGAKPAAGTEPSGIGIAVDSML